MTNMRYGHMSLLLALYGVTTLLTASQWICNNIYDNRVNCRCMGFASLIHTNFSFEQQDDHCPNRSTTPLPMWYIVSPPSPGLSIDSQQSEPLPPWRGMQLPPPHSIVHFVCWSLILLVRKVKVQVMKVKVVIVLPDEECNCPYPRVCKL